MKTETIKFGKKEFPVARSTDDNGAVMRCETDSGVYKWSQGELLTFRPKGSSAKWLHLPYTEKPTMFGNTADAEKYMVEHYTTGRLDNV